MQVYRVDENGFYVEDVIFEGEEIPNDCVTERPPQPCWKPRWIGTEWVEEGAPPEPETILPTIEERLEALEAAMLDVILGGGL